MKLEFATQYKLRKQLELHESYEAFPYVDSVGKITIGVGHNLSDRGVSDRVIDLLFEEDLEVAINDLDRIFPQWRELSENRQLVLLDMSFNLGYDRLSKFKKTLGFIEEGMFKEASVQMLHSKWAKQVKGRAKRLARMMEVG